MENFSGIIGYNLKRQATLGIKWFTKSVKERKGKPVSVVTYYIDTAL